MSKQSWLKEFYPVPAKYVDPLDALDHSIRKWRGVLPSNLRRHGCMVFLQQVIFRGTLVLGLNGSSCALCYAHFCDDYSSPRCSKCPLRLYKLAKGIEFSEHEGACQDEFELGPKAMLKLLRAARKWMCEKI